MKNKNYFISLGFLLLFIGLILGIFLMRHNETFLSTSSLFPSSVESATATNPAISHGKININIASAEELSYLPGLGTTLAIRIVQYRIENGRFTTTKSLMNVDGITKSTYEKLVQYITVD